MLFFLKKFICHGIYNNYSDTGCVIMNDADDFEDKFTKISQYYHIDSPIDIKNQIRKNKNIFSLLNEIKPGLEEYFPQAEFALQMNFEPESDDKFIILRIDVAKNRFNTKLVERIREFELKIWDLEKRLNVLREVLIMPNVAV